MDEKIAPKLQQLSSKLFGIKSTKTAVSEDLPIFPQLAN
jgi:hypothetical protein